MYLENQLSTMLFVQTKILVFGVEQQKMKENQLEESTKKKAEKGEEVNDDLVLGVISSYVKKMIKAVEEYQSLGDRGQEMAEKIQFEINFLSTYLPEQLSDEEVEKIVDEVLSELGDVDISQMGRVIGAVMAKDNGIDGSVVSKIVQTKLT